MRHRSGLLGASAADLGFGRSGRRRGVGSGRAAILVAGHDTRPLGGRHRLAALGWLPNHLAGVVLDPLALGPLLAVAGLLLGQLGLALDVDPPTR